MRFTPLALAAGLVAAAGASQAQSSNVTVYGFLDVGIHKSNKSEWQLGTIQRSSLGFKGQEDLGGGLAATFHLQSRFDLGDGTLESSGRTPFYQGESTVGLKGDFGHIRLGRALTPLWAHDWAFDPWANFHRVASIAWFIYHPSFRSDPHHNGPIGEYSRLNNGIFFDSATYGGWSLHLSLGAEKKTDPDQNGLSDSGRSLGASLNYAGGPLAAMLSAERNSAKDETYFAGASYRLGAATVMGSYNHTRLSSQSQAFLGDADATRRAATLGATYAIDTHTLRLGLGRDFEGYGQAGATNYVSAGWSQALSKRTTIYADVGTQKARHADRVNRYGAGISHAF